MYQKHIVFYRIHYTFESFNIFKWQNLNFTYYAEHILDPERSQKAIDFYRRVFVLFFYCLCHVYFFNYYVHKLYVLWCNNSKITKWSERKQYFTLRPIHCDWILDSYYHPVHSTILECTYRGLLRRAGKIFS